jgi:hypothetical protein
VAESLRETSEILSEYQNDTSQLFEVEHGSRESQHAKHVRHLQEWAASCAHASHFIWSKLPSTTVIGVAYDHSLLVVNGPCLLVFGVAFLQTCLDGETYLFLTLATTKKSDKSFINMKEGLYFSIF